jgi:hypothetical protein
VHASARGGGPARDTSPPGDTALHPPILVAGQTREVTLDGVAYTLRAPSYGEHSAIDVDLAATPAPSPEVIDDALITAAEAAGRADLVEAIRALPEARDTLADFYASCPPSLDDEGRRRWLDENRAALREIERARHALESKRKVALEIFADTPGIAELRRRADVAVHRRMALIVAAGIHQVDGQRVMLALPDVQALPSGHVRILFEAVSALMVPELDAAKNSSRPSTAPATPTASPSASGRKKAAGSRSGSGGAAKSSGGATRATSSRPRGRG